MNVAAYGFALLLGAFITIARAPAHLRYWFRDGNHH